MPIIDADAHVIETDRTWDFMEEAERGFRPGLGRGERSGEGRPDPRVLAGSATVSTRAGSSRSSEPAPTWSARSCSTSMRG